MLKHPEHFDDRVGDTIIVIGQSAGNLITVNLFMINKQNNLGIYLKPGQRVPESLLDQLKQINQQYTNTKKFFQYEKQIRALFQLDPPRKKTKTTFFYLAGFIEGEASLNLGAKKNQTSRFQVFFDPEFNITQHINGIQNLCLALDVFQTGRIRFKSGSLATFVYTIDNRQALKEKVVPFYETYVKPYGSKNKIDRVKQFKRVLTLFEEKAHLNYDQMINEFIPLWASLKMQHNSNQTFKNETEAKLFIQKAHLQAKLKSSETITSS